MDFAKNLLNKYGWQEGDGLGKEKQGITRPIKASLKFDQAGLGADSSGDFGNNWWERCFNDAAQNVKVVKEESGKVSVDLENADNSVEVSTKSISIKKLKARGVSSYDSNFLAENIAVSDFELTKYKVLSDEDLLKACGGRTAHKGARHGLKLSGKLARLEQQEKELLAKMHNRSKAVSSQESPKIYKRKVADLIQENNQINETNIVQNSPTETTHEDCLENANNESERRKKRKKHKKEFLEEKNIDLTETIIENSTEIAKTKKKKNKKSNIEENKKTAKSKTK